MKMALPLLFLLLFGAFAFTQTKTYVQTTATCNERSCTDARFTPTATLSYNVNLQSCGGNFSGVIAWNNTAYGDFTGTYKWIGYYSYPFHGKYLLQGKFDSGLYTVSETFETGFRNCEPVSNLSGTVAGP